MICIKLLGNSRAVLDNVSEPSIEDGNILIKMKTMDLCGSDINLRCRPSHQESKKMVDELGIAYDPNTIPGHEIAGEVIDTGNNTRFNKGKNVFIFPFISSKSSIFYEEKMLKYCKPLQTIGYTVDGGNSEYLSIPAENYYRIPDYVSLNQAAMLLGPISAPYGVIGELGFINNVSVSDLIVYKDLIICGSWVYDPEKLSDLYELLKNGLKIEKIITNTFPLEKSLEAWELFNTGKTGKIVVYQN